MTIEQILEDCYAIDPTLREHDAELRRAVEQMLLAKPDARPDAAFVARLRKEIQREAAAIHANDPVPMQHRDFLSYFRLPMPAGTVIAAALLLAVAGSAVPGLQRTATDSSTPSSAPSREGFGPLALTSGPGAESNRFQGGGGGGGSAPLGSPSAISAVAPDAKMIAPVEYAQYRFVYRGESPEAPSADIVVLRRIKGLPIGNVSSTGAIASLVDLSRLSNARLQSYAIAEDREFGYVAFVDGTEGSVNLAQNWTRWPHPENQCRDEACWAQYRIAPDQVPADAEMIAVADRFLNEYGISREGLGTPEVRNEWRIAYAAASVTDRASYVAPESFSVVYPFVIDGQKIVDDGGAANGLQVNVNIRHMRVDGVWNLIGRDVERSTYVGETNVSRILSFAERGGVWGGQFDPNVKIVDVEIGAPELVYLRSWKGREDGTSDDLFVPAWRFPVLNAPADQPWFRSAVVIPLAKELLDAADQQQGGGVTPLMVKPAMPTATEPAVDPAVR